MLSSHFIIVSFSLKEEMASCDFWLLQMAWNLSGFAFFKFSVNHCISKILSPFIYLQLLSRSITDHHLRCGGWLNFEFSKRGKTFGMGH